MKVLLEIKQKIKSFYSNNEIFLLPILKFVLSYACFSWINKNMGYMARLNNLFIVLILSLICCILPPGALMFAAIIMIVAHGYGLGLEVAGFLLAMLLFMLILFLRFSPGKNVIVVLSPLAYAVNMPVLLPIGCGLLSSPVSALPAGCGVIVYYFIRFIGNQAQVLQDPEIPPVNKVILMADGLTQSWAMWLNVIAVIAVILVVNLIRTRSFDYAWRIAIVVGGFLYAAIMLAGGVFLSVEIHVELLAGFTAAAVLIGLFLEFFVFGGDYSRVEQLQYEDDEYYYYVKAVPKAAVASSERSIKKITAEPIKEEKAEEKVLTYANPIFRENRQKKEKTPLKENEQEQQEQDHLEDIDFEKKLEESLGDL